MNTYKSISGLKLSMLGILLLEILANTSFADHRENKSNFSRAPLQSPIQLVLKTTKMTYRKNEPIKLSCYLQNMSAQESYYVGNSLGSFIMEGPYHFVDLRITDKSGKEVSRGKVGATAIWPPGTSLKDKLLSQYLLLRPGMFFGQEDEGDISLAPGQYILTAIYHETEVKRWTKEELNLLPHPVWVESIVSNKVIITVHS